MKIVNEHIPCPVGCKVNDNIVLTGRDRLHNLPGQFTLVECGDCGLMRLNPRPTRTSIGFYYPEEYAPYRNTRVENPSGPQRPASSWKRLFRGVLDLETKKIPPVQPGRMLEIGCASGAFLHSMARLGWEVEGLEFSEKAATMARALGHRIHAGPLESAPNPKEPYDLIVGWMVLEHLHNPIAALQRLHGWTRKDGRLVLSVPDAGSLEFRIFKDAWYALDLPRHLYHYTLKSLSNVLRHSGWEIDHVFWHNNANNLVQSLRYVCIDRDWTNIATYLLDIFEGRRHRYLHLFMGKLLGTLHASGRITVWAAPT